MFWVLCSFPPPLHAPPSAVCWWFTEEIGKEQGEGHRPLMFRLPPLRPRLHVYRLLSRFRQRGEGGDGRAALERRAASLLFGRRGRSVRRHLRVKMLVVLFWSAQQRRGAKCLFLCLKIAYFLAKLSRMYYSSTYNQTLNMQHPRRATSKKSQDMHTNYADYQVSPTQQNWRHIRGEARVCLYIIYSKSLMVSSCFRNKIVLLRRPPQCVFQHQF